MLLLQFFSNDFILRYSEIRYSRKKQQGTNPTFTGTNFRLNANSTSLKER